MFAIAYSEVQGHSDTKTERIFIFHCPMIAYLITLCHIQDASADTFYAILLFVINIFIAILSHGFVL